MKKEHVVLFDILFRSMEHAAGSEQLRESLDSFKEEFLRHARKEEEKLYPVLVRASQNDPRLVQTAARFLAEMKTVVSEVERFVGKYSVGGGPEEFALDCRRIFVTLKERTEREEAELFSEYEKIAQ